MLPIKKIYLCWLLAYVLMPTGAYAQAADSTDRAMDTTYIREFKEKLSLRLLGAMKSLKLNARGTENDTVYQYGPRYRYYTGIGGSLWNVGFTLLVPVSRLVKDEEVDVFRLNLQSSLFAHRWLLSGSYQRYKGYYIRPAGQFKTWTQEQFRQQMFSQKLEGSITYLPNGNRLSLRAPYNQAVQQIKSAGSFIMSGGFSYFLLKDRTGILPYALQPDDQLPVRSLRIYAINTLTGYACTLVHRHFYLHLYGLTGFAFQLQKYGSDTEVKAFAVKPVYDGRAAIWYDNGDMYGGVYALANYNDFQVQQIAFGQTTTQIRFFVGLRLNQPGWLRKLKPAFLDKWRNSPTLPFPSIFE